MLSVSHTASTLPYPVGVSSVVLISAYAVWAEGLAAPTSFCRSGMCMYMLCRKIWQCCRLSQDLGHTASVHSWSTAAAFVCFQLLYTLLCWQQTYVWPARQSGLRTRATPKQSLPACSWLLPLLLLLVLVDVRLQVSSRTRCGFYRECTACEWQAVTQRSMVTRLAR